MRGASAGKPSLKRAKVGGRGPETLLKKVAMRCG